MTHQTKFVSVRQAGEKKCMNVQKRIMCGMFCCLQYLYNLDVNSAYYDPKTRSMRENPFPGKHSNE